MKLRFTPRAVQDLADIAGFVREQNPPAALRVRAAILESLQNLVLFPHVGRQQKVEHVRKLVTRRYRYLVYYTADEQSEEIVILTISTPLVIASMRTLSPAVAFGPWLDEPKLAATCPPSPTSFEVTVFARSRAKAGAGGRSRTGTAIAHRGILSPLRLPIPPRPHFFMNQLLREKSQINPTDGVRIL